MKTVVKSAVMAKSIPVESNSSIVPTSPPRKEPTIHADMSNNVTRNLYALSFTPSGISPLERTA